MTFCREFLLCALALPSNREGAMGFSIPLKLIGDIGANEKPVATSVI
jgi:hypothetical protein